MKPMLYGIIGTLAITTALPATAQMHSHSVQENIHGGVTATAPQDTRATDGVITRTIVIGETPLYGQQIAAALENHANATHFRHALQSSGISASLRDGGKGYTAFVPVDDAFRAASINPPAAPRADGTIDTTLRRVLEQHITPEKFDLNLMRGSRTTVTGIDGNRIIISKAGHSYYANGKLIVDRQRNPEGILYFVDGFVTEPGFSAATTYNPFDATK